MKEKIKIKLEEGVELPQYATEGSVGFDLKAIKVLKIFQGEVEQSIEPHISVENGFVLLEGHHRALFGTGIFIELPVGMELQIRPRSGNSLKRGLAVSFGTIDHDYRGEIGIIVTNTNERSLRVYLGEAIAQGVLAYVPQAEWEIATELSTTERGSGGFGHSGNGIK